MPVPTTPKRGRPATGSNRTRITIAVPPKLAEAARKKAYKKGESTSHFISRAIQNLLLEP